MFLAVGLWPLLAYHLTENHHPAIEAGILCLRLLNVWWPFLSVYYWGSYFRLIIVKKKNGNRNFALFIWFTFTLINTLIKNSFFINDFINITLEMA